MRSLFSRSFEVFVLGLALYTVFAVPLGRRTLAGHVAAIFATPVAKEAVSDVTSAVKRLLPGAR